MSVTPVSSVLLLKVQKDNRLKELKTLNDIKSLFSKPNYFNCFITDWFISDALSPPSPPISGPSFDKIYSLKASNSSMVV